jgi:hypothetical protein
VLDENSEAIPLASQEAAEIVAGTDPMWCPAGVQPGGAGCTTSFLTPQELIDALDDSDPGTTNSIFEQDGIIYFTADPGGQFVLRSGGGNSVQSADYEALKIFNLALQGGWNGETGVPSADRPTLARTAFRLVRILIRGEGISRSTILQSTAWRTILHWW